MYRELIADETEAKVWRTTQKWKQDPDSNRFGGHFAPRNTYYINGLPVGEDIPIRSETSKMPFLEKRAPRRGLLQVYPNDPDYARICAEQGLDHLLNGNRRSSMANGVHTPPASHSDLPMGTSPRDIDDTMGDNGSNEANGSHTGTVTNGGMPNGTNRTTT